MFDEVVECINLLVVPSYSFLIECSSLETKNDGDIKVTFICNSNYRVSDIINFSDIREDIKTIFKMLDRYCSRIFFWINLNPQA